MIRTAVAGALALSLGAAGALAQSPPPAAGSPPKAAPGPTAPAQQGPLGQTEFAPIFVGGNYVAFASPQLVVRDATRAQGTMVQVADPPAPNGVVTAAWTQSYDCQAGTFRSLLIVMRNEKGDEVGRQTPNSEPAKAEAGSATEALMTFVCTGKLKDDKVPHFPDLKTAYANARAVLARNRAVRSPTKQDPAPLKLGPPSMPKTAPAPKLGPSPAPPPTYGR
ncbi:MAG: hypothetical protein WCI21_03395 [Alphaproteobacteria bacterium]